MRSELLVCPLVRMQDACELLVINVIRPVMSVMDDVVLTEVDVVPKLGSKEVNSIKAQCFN